MAYTKNTWVDDDPTKPLSASRMTTIEQGVFDAHTLVSLAQATANNAIPKNTVIINVKDPQNDASGNLQPGAAGDYGTTDDTEAIKRALLAVPFGGIVFFPSGGYKLTSPIDVPAGVTIQGAGRYNSGIRFDNASTNGFNLNSQCVVRDISLNSTVTHSAGSHLYINANAVQIQSVNFGGYFTAITVGATGNPATSVRIVNCDFGTTNTGGSGAAIYAVSYASLLIDQCVILGTSSGTQPSYGIRIQQGDTSIISNCNITRHGVALQIDPAAGTHAFATMVTNSLFDSTGATGINGSPSSCYVGGTGTVDGVKFSNCWFGYSLSGGSGCYLGNGTSTSVVDGVSFTGCEFCHNTDNGLNVVSSGGVVRNVIVNGGWSAGNTNYGLRFYNVVGFTVSGHRAGPASDGGSNGSYGINVDAQPSNNYVITGCNTAGNAGGGIYSGGTGTNKVVANNV